MLRLDYLCDKGMATAQWGKPSSSRPGFDEADYKITPENEKVIQAVLDVR